MGRFPSRNSLLPQAQSSRSALQRVPATAAGVEGVQQGCDDGWGGEGGGKAEMSSFIHSWAVPKPRTPGFPLASWFSLGALPNKAALPPGTHPGWAGGDPGHFPAPPCPRLFHVSFRSVIPSQTQGSCTRTAALQRWSQELAGFVNRRDQFSVLPPGWSCSLLPSTNTCGALHLHSAAHPSSHLRSPSQPGLGGFPKGAELGTTD